MHYMLLFSNVVFADDAIFGNSGGEFSLDSGAAALRGQAISAQVGYRLSDKRTSGKRFRPTGISLG